MRNRDDTRSHILDAAITSLAEDGFAGFGVNSVARRAGYDKKLIYRYFDGMDGLVAAMGEAVAADLTEALTPHLLPPPATYAALIERLALALFDHLWGNARFRQMRLMEAAAPSDATQAFRAARGNALHSWMIAARGGLMPPTGDVAAWNASLIAMVEGLTLLGAAGIDEGDAGSKPRLRDALLRTVIALFASEAT
jgi:AcrR family transcriptional regulator